jgi:DeoR/GlpR family transcriptional regulator of sugar metabolism
MKVQEIMEWVTKRTDAVSVKDIAKKFKCSERTAYAAVNKLMAERRVDVCHFGRERHYSKRRNH